MKMISLQTTIIAALIALSMGGVGGSVAAWSLTKNHYEAVLSENARKASEAARLAEQKLATTVANLNSDSVKVLNQVSTAFQEKLNAAEKTNADYARRISTGALVLRDPGTRGPNQVPKDRSGPAACSADGSTGGQLSSEAAGFLWGEASRADQYVEQLTALQATNRSYWELITKYGLEIEALTKDMAR